MRFPESLPDRMSFILECIKSGDFEASWTRVSYERNGKYIEVDVMSDALKIDGVRVNVDATTSQTVADMIDAVMPTSLLADVIHGKSTRRIPPRPRPITSSAAAMIDQSRLIDDDLSTQTSPGIISTAGKHWIVDGRLSSGKVACNYGWHFDPGKYRGGGSPADCGDLAGFGVKVIQSPGTFHDRFHTDYSQICQLVARVALVDGVPMRIDEALEDPQHERLFSAYGTSRISRQPGVARYSGPIILFPTTIVASLPGLV